MARDTIASAGIVRPARRPVGWEVAGPVPAAPRNQPELWPRAGEDLCYLAGDWRILQRLDGHRWSLDDLMTAWLAVDVRRGAPPARVADLGCGIGSVLMLLAWRFPAARCLGIEAQAVSVDLARRSLAWNGAAARCEVRLGDLRDSALVPEGTVFDLVTGTPPYLRPGAATASARVQCDPCRFTHRGGIEDYCVAAARLLAPGASFVACEMAGRSEAVAAAAARAGLVVARRLDVIPRDGKPPLFSVYAMRRADETVAHPAISSVSVRDARARRTEPFRAIRLDLGMPP
jgi:tRNA1Val (adenine37-N6)-methyltransferase